MVVRPNMDRFSKDKEKRTAALINKASKLLAEASRDLQTRYWSEGNPVVPGSELHQSIRRINRLVDDTNETVGPVISGRRSSEELSQQLIQKGAADFRFYANEAVALLEQIPADKYPSDSLHQALVELETLAENFAQYVGLGPPPSSGEANRSIDDACPDVARNDPSVRSVEQQLQQVVAGSMEVKKREKEIEPS